MLKKGNTAETIASMTDVSLETVKEIKKKDFSSCINGKNT